MKVTYKTIAERSEGLFKDRGSKFIAVAMPAQSQDEVKGALEDLRREYHDARHHCYAFRLGADGSEYRYSDDGEPANSAGPPIHGQLLAKDVTNVLAVVIRYFGGTKLGVGGLINAYKMATSEALSRAQIIDVEVKQHYKVWFSYEQTSPVMRLFDQLDVDIKEQHFSDSCEADIMVGMDLTDRLQHELSLLQIKWEVKG